MSDIKRMDIAEFQQLGYLQEANRQFFHPHGLALEITVVEEGGDDGMRQRIRGALERYAGGVDREHDDFGEPGVSFLARAIDEMTEAVLAELVPVGSRRLSGVWDYRDDPEGVVFGCGGYGDSGEKAERVRQERIRHFEARARMFHPTLDLTYPHILEGPDVEPLNWTDSE